MGTLPDFLPGYQSVSDAQARKSFEERWGVGLPDNAGLTAMEMIEQAQAGKIKGMLIVGENPLASFPSPSTVKNALASLKFLAVCDLFLTETAKLATVVLPTASFAEKEGTFTNFEGRVQRVRKAIEPLRESLPDSEIIMRLAGKMGHPMQYISTKQIIEEIEELVPPYQSLAYGDFDTQDIDWADFESGRQSAKRLYKGLFPSGFGRFATVNYTPLADSRDGYPITLISGSVLYHLGSGTRSSRASRLKKFAPNSWIEISEPDAAQLGFNQGDSVSVVSPAGKVKTSVRITDTLPEGMVFMPISFPESPISLFDVVLDPKSKTPSLKRCAVRLERIVVNG
jgi:predicted molibdopterin-dependent oxidoreductase YjgC